MRLLKLAFEDIYEEINQDPPLIPTPKLNFERVTIFASLDKVYSLLNSNEIHQDLIVSAISEKSKFVKTKGLYTRPHSLVNFGSAMEFGNFAAVNFHAPYFAFPDSRIFAVGTKASGLVILSNSKNVFTFLIETPKNGSEITFSEVRNRISDITLPKKADPAILDLIENLCQKHKIGYVKL